jgi:hypothetical protein
MAVTETAVPFVAVVASILLVVPWGKHGTDKQAEENS